MSGEPTSDRWCQWLLTHRFGGDDEFAERYLQVLRGVRDAVLDGAKLTEGSVLLDVGAGDGLIAFGALERVGAAGQVIFVDISQPLLDHAQAVAKEKGVVDRCSFVNAPAEDLEPIRSDSVDAVTTRSVLIYVADKPRAFREFYRALKRGGRISLHEPINRYWVGTEPEDWMFGLEIREVADLVQRLRRFYRELQPLETDPMMNFDEHDLVALGEGAGFVDLHLTLHVVVRRRTPTKWEVFMNASGNPNIPSRREAIARLFRSDDAARYEAHLRPVVEAGVGVTRDAIAYLTGTKPAVVGP